MQFWGLNSRPQNRKAYVFYHLRYLPDPILFDFKAIFSGSATQHSLMVLPFLPFASRYVGFGRCIKDSGCLYILGVFTF